MENDLILSVLLAFVGNAMIAVGQSVQKSQVSRFDRNDESKRKTIKILIWILGIALSNGGLVFIYKAIAVGYTSIVGAMNASALMVLLLVARFFLKEKIEPHEIWGVILIFVGVVIIPLFPSSHEPHYRFSVPVLWITVGAIVTLFITILIITGKRKVPRGILLAMFAGALTSASQVFQKVANLPEVIAELGGGWGLVHRWVFLPFLGASFLCLQFAYRKNKAVTVIPVFNAVVVGLPVIAGQVFFDERLSIMQWFGVVLIFVGVVVINIYNRVLEKENGKDISNVIES